MTSTETPIADQVTTLTQDASAHLPADVLDAFRAEQALLDAAGMPAGIATPGTPMPDGALLDARSNATTLAQARAGAPSVVVFYRGAWCPYCNLALRAYQRELADELTRRGVALIAISPQKPDGTLSAQETNELSFPVLSDPGNQIGAELGILTRPTERARQAQASLGLDLAEVNADGTRDLVMPTVAIVDADGVLRWIDVHPNYTTRTEPARIRAALDEVLG
jgi:peroxiredoxin